MLRGIDNIKCDCDLGVERLRRVHAEIGSNIEAQAVRAGIGNRRGGVRSRSNSAIGIRGGLAENFPFGSRQRAPRHYGNAPGGTSA